jgi:hypothetical protein
MALSIFVWVMIGMALWHFSVLVPDKFWGGIVGAFGAAVAGALLSGYLLPEPGIPASNPPGSGAAVWAMPGSLIALLVSYLYGARRRMGVCTHGRGPLRRPRLFDDSACRDS